VPTCGTSLLLVIEKFPGANTREVTQGIDAALADMAPGLNGITIHRDLYRPVSYLDSALGNAAVIGLICFVLLVAALQFEGGRRPGVYREQGAVVRVREIRRVAQCGQAARAAADPGNDPPHARHGQAPPAPVYDPLPAVLLVVCGGAGSGVCRRCSPDGDSLAGPG
jgi:hypothetical protein